MDWERERVLKVIRVESMDERLGGGEVCLAGRWGGVFGWEGNKQCN